MADNLTTGKTQLNSQLVSGAASLAGPAADLANGASKLQVASNFLKDAALDKLLGPAAAFAGLLAGSLIVVRKLVRESLILEKGLTKISRLQQIEGKFETLLKSATLAKQRIKELYEFTARSPFKFEDVAEANRQLEALTYGAFSGKKAMQMVGDAAAATGQSMSEMSERVGKLYAALSSGRSIDKIAFQLQFTGLATEGLLGKLESLEQAGAGFNEMWGEVEKVMSRTAGGMENEMTTLESLSTKLEEARSGMQKAFAQPFVEAQSKAIVTMTNATKNLTPVLAKVGEDIAAVKGAFVDLKTNILDVTLASPGMAKALEATWTVAKTLWVGLAAVTVAAAAKGAAGMGLFVTSSIAAARSVFTLTTATTAWTAATQAASAGNLRLAASHALVAARTLITTAASALHSAGMTAAATSTGFAAAANYVLAASTVTVAGALRLAGKGLMFLAAQARAAILALGPIGLLWTAAAGLAMALVSVTRGAAAAAKEFDQMAAAAGEADKKLRDLLATAKTTDDWAKYMAAATDEIAKAEQAVTDLKARMAERGAWTKFWGFFTGENIRLDGAAKDAARRPEMLRAGRAASVKTLPFMGMGTKQSEAFARDLQTAQSMSDSALEDRLQSADDAARVKLLEQEADRLGKIAKAAKAARDVMEQFNDSTDKLKADMALADAQGAKGLADAALPAGVESDPGALARRRKELADFDARMNSPQSYAEFQKSGQTAEDLGIEKDPTKRTAQIAALDAAIAANAQLAAAEKTLADLRRASTSELVRNNQEIADIGAKGKDQTETDKLRLVELQKQNLALLDQVKNADALAAAEQQRQFQLKAARDTQAANAAGAALDPALLVATAQGNDALVAELQMKKELAVLQERINQADRDGNAVLAEALTLEAAMIVARKAAADAKFKADRDADARADDAAIRGDKKGAQAIRDAKDLRALQKEYEANGMTAAQATADFQRALVADAAGRQPQILADSMAAIGGGGNAFQGVDPAIAAQERATRAAEQAAKDAAAARALLAEIRDNTREED